MPTWIQTHTHTYGNVTDCLYCMQLRRTSKTLFQENFSLSFSLSLYCLCDSWPRGHLPHCAFVPMPIQHYLKPSAAAAAAQHNHGKVPLVAAKSAFQQGNSHCSRAQWSDSEWKLFPLFPRYLCSIADTPKPKIDWIFFSAIAHLQLCNDIVWSQSVQISYTVPFIILSWILERLTTATYWETNHWVLMHFHWWDFHPILTVAVLFFHLSTRKWIVKYSWCKLFLCRY